MDKIENGVYQHFKGGHVNVLLTAEHTEVDEVLVVYQGLNNGKYYARPIESFCAVVDGIARFKKIDESQAPVYNGELPTSKIEVGEYLLPSGKVNVLFTAKHSDREEIEVVYQKNSNKKYYATTLEEFNNKINIVKER